MSSVKNAEYWRDYRKRKGMLVERCSAKGCRAKRHWRSFMFCPRHRKMVIDGVDFEANAITERA